MPLGTPEQEAFAAMMKANPLLGMGMGMNPAALLSMSPQLTQVYALQLQAQLQAQMMSAASPGIKRKREDEASAETAAAMAAMLNPALAGALNLSRRSPTPPPKNRAESPLDLSGSPVEQALLGKGPKVPKLDDAVAKFQPWNTSPAAAAGFPFVNPFLSGAAAAGGVDPLTHKFPGLAGVGGPTSPSNPFFPKVSSPSKSSDLSMPDNPLERMNKIAKTGCPPKPPPNGTGRHSAWQSQWISRGPENAKDIFKCFTCKNSYPSMIDLTKHMKDTGHYQTATSVAQPHHAPSPPMPHRKSPPSTYKPAEKSTKRDILKEQVPVPRKLVRGQDVWLGKGEEQTRHILKCMQCSQSFRSLSDLTQHMTETQHFKKVMSQENLGGGTGPVGSKSTIASPSSSPSSTRSTVSANDHLNSSILSCKVCGQAFNTLKQLGDHVMKHNHFGDSLPLPPGFKKGGMDDHSLQKPISSPITSPAPVTTGNSGGGSRKSKSLPVKMLLEMERAAKQQRQVQPSSPPTMVPGQGDRHGEDSPMLAFLQQSLENSMKKAAAATRESAVSPPMLPNPRPESAKSSASSVVSNEDSRSAKSSKSILGSLEDMVNHNFNGSSVQQQRHLESNSQSVTSDRSSVSPLRSSPATPMKTPNSALEKVPEEKETSSKPTTGHNPLAALQSLCDSAEKSSKSAGNRPEAPSMGPNPGSILAFSWACNQAVVDESVLKCHLCDAPFVSKGAYRHHLSKVHFINGQVENSKEGAAAGKEGAEAKEAKDNGSNGNSEGAEEDSQSKYHKYAEMAKQLSSQTKTLSTIA